MNRVERLEGRTLFASYALRKVTALIAAMNATPAAAGQGVPQEAREKGPKELAGR